MNNAKNAWLFFVDTTESKLCGFIYSIQNTLYMQIVYINPFLLTTLE